MKRTVKLTEPEKQTLQELSLKHRHRDFRIRGRALLELNGGRRVKEIALELGVSDRSVYNWAYAWKRVGLCGLLTGHKGGRPRVLPDAMIATAVEAARVQLLTLRQIALRVEEVHGQPLPCTLATLSAALRHEGFSYKNGRYARKKDVQSSSLLWPASLGRVCDWLIEAE
jgi:transposase